MLVVEEGAPLVHDVERSEEQEQAIVTVASRRRMVGIGAVGTLVVFAIMGALATSRSAAEKADTSDAIDMAMINTGNCMTGLMCMAAAKKKIKNGITFCCPPQFTSMSTSDSGGAVSCSCSGGGAAYGQNVNNGGDEDEDEDGSPSYSAAPMAPAAPGGANVPPNVMPGNCMVGAQCQGQNVGKTGFKNGIFFCCPLGMTGMSTGDSNGMVTCSCS